MYIEIFRAFFDINFFMISSSLKNIIKKRIGIIAGAFLKHRLLYSATFPHHLYTSLNEGSSKVLRLGHVLKVFFSFMYSIGFFIIDMRVSRKVKGISLSSPSTSTDVFDLKSLYVDASPACIGFTLVAAKTSVPARTIAATSNLVHWRRITLLIVGRNSR